MVAAIDAATGQALPAVVAVEGALQPVQMGVGAVVSRQLVFESGVEAGVEALECTRSRECSRMSQDTCSLCVGIFDRSNRVLETTLRVDYRMFKGRLEPSSSTWRCRATAKRAASYECTRLGTPQVVSRGLFEWNHVQKKRQFSLSLSLSLSRKRAIPRDPGGSPFSIVQRVAVTVNSLDTFFFWLFHHFHFS